MSEPMPTTRKVESGTLDTRQKLACFLENCDLLTHTFEMRMHQRLPGCHQTGQEALGHLSAALCVLILPTCHHRRQCATQHRLRNTSHHHLHNHRLVDQHHSRKMHVPRATRHSKRSRQMQPLPTAATTASVFLPLASLAANAASRHSVLMASTKSENCKLVPLLSTSAPVVTAAKLLEVKLGVSANKMPRTLSCRRSLLISDVEVFNAWPTFRYCSANRRVLCLHEFHHSVLSEKTGLKKSNSKRPPSWVDFGPTERPNFFTTARAPDPSAAPSSVRHVASNLSRCVSISLRGVGDHSSISPPLSKTRRIFLAFQTNSSVAASSIHRGREEWTSWPPEDISKLTKPLLPYQ